MSYEYTIAAVLSAVLVVLAERRWLRTGLFRSPSYWATMGICLFFMVLVNGWLTKLSAPIVVYAAEERTAWRFPWDIPVEDYFFGFSLITTVLLLWVRQDTPADPAPWSPARAGGGEVQAVGAADTGTEAGHR